MRRKGVGRICNDFSGNGDSGAEFNVLHYADCPTLERANLNVRKYFFTDGGEAREWLTTHRGPEGTNWKRCGTCDG